MLWRHFLCKSAPHTGNERLKSFFVFPMRHVWSVGVIWMIRIGERRGTKKFDSGMESSFPYPTIIKIGLRHPSFLGKTTFFQWKKRARHNECSSSFMTYSFSPFVRCWCGVAGPRFRDKMNHSICNISRRLSSFLSRHWTGLVPILRKWILWAKQAMSSFLNCHLFFLKADWRTKLKNFLVNVLFISFSSLCKDNSRKSSGVAWNYLHRVRSLKIQNALSNFILLLCSSLAVCLGPEPSLPPPQCVYHVQAEHV